MTKEEIIAQLKTVYPKCSKMVNYRLQGGFIDHDAPLGQAIDEAIKVLEQEPCENVVSRAEVKKIAKEMYLEVANMELDVSTISDCISYTSSKCREVLERKLQALLSVTPQEPRWIPATERLPEYCKEVLTCSNGGFIEIQSLEESYGGYWENQKGDWADFDEVIAWMPLPEPYKAESEDE